MLPLMGKLSRPSAPRMCSNAPEISAFLSELALAARLRVVESYPIIKPGFGLSAFQFARGKARGGGPELNLARMGWGSE